MATQDLAALLSAPLLSTDGATTTLRQQLGPHAVVVVFLRHFG